jgi:hypothetical protein
MRRAPLSPLISRRQVGSTPQASGVTMPSPVTTTRLIFDSIERVQQELLRRALIPATAWSAPDDATAQPTSYVGDAAVRQGKV